MARTKAAFLAVGAMGVLLGVILGFRPVATESSWIRIGNLSLVSCGSAFLPTDSAARTDDAHRVASPMSIRASAISGCQSARQGAMDESVTLLSAGLVLLAGGVLVPPTFSRRRAQTRLNVGEVPAPR